VTTVPDVSVLQFGQQSALDQESSVKNSEAIDRSR
jgi:hypothetical protein